MVDIDEVNNIFNNSNDKFIEEIKEEPRNPKVPKQLTPFKKKGDPRSDELRRRQLGSGSQKRKDALKKIASKKAKCKRCHLECDFRKVNTMNNPEALCVVPSMRASASSDGSGRVVEWNDNRIKYYVNELLEMYRKILVDDAKLEEDEKKVKRESIRDFNVMMNRLMEFKEKFYPAVQKTENINIQTSWDGMIERLKEYKQQEQQELMIANQKIIVSGVKKDKEVDEDEVEEDKKEDRNKCEV